MSLLIKALITSLIVAIGFNDKYFLSTFIYRPIVIGPAVGLVFGNVPMGLEVGVAIEIMFLAVIWVGTAIPPDETISTALATAIACMSGNAQLAIATALPLSFVGQIFRQTKMSTIYEWTMTKVLKAAEKADGKGVVIWTTVVPAIIEYVLFGIPTFIGIYLGEAAITAFIDAVPNWLIDGIACGTGLLGAIGVALLLGSIKDKSSWPFFILGYFFASYLGIDMIGTALIAIFVVALYYYRDKREREKAIEAGEIEATVEADTSYRIITRKDLWKTFKYGLAIESGNCTTRQEANGFLQAMVPVLDKVYTDPQEREEAYMRHTELFLTEGRMAETCVGIACAMEERLAIKKDIDPDSINQVKVALMGPLAGVGDSLIHGTLRPIMAGLACSLVMASGYTSVLGPVLFVLIMTTVTMAIRYFGIFKGYEQGLQLVANLQEGGMLDRLTKYAGIAAFIVCGGFMSALVWLEFSVSYVQGDTIISLQQTLDGLLPQLVPLLYTLFIYWAIEKKHANVTLLMFLTIVLGCVLVVLGIC